MYSVPQIEALVKAAPMPLHLKEQLLDAALGQHDALNRPDRKTKNVRPMSERVGEARRIGAFEYLRTELNGDEIFAYCKVGKRAYEVVIRDGKAVHCGCKNFELETAIDPEYHCKHLILFDTMTATLEDLIADAGAAAGAFMQAWLRQQIGTGSPEETNAAGRRQDEARAKVECFFPMRDAAELVDRKQIQ